MISFFNRMISEGLGKTDALQRTCQIQMRPVLMTLRRRLCRAVAGRLFHRHRLPGAEPLALVVVGGMLLARACILLVLPVLIDLFSRRAEAKRPGPQLQPAE